MKMINYRTLNNGSYVIDNMPAKEQEIFERVYKYFRTDPDWSTFGNYWMGIVFKNWNGKPREKVIETPLYKICQDMESRLGLKYGFVREGDYRDDLEQVINEKYESQEKFCNENNISNEELSSVFCENKHININKLMKIAEKNSMRVALIPNSSQEYISEK